MKMKVLSTLVFSIMFFASMYGEAKDPVPTGTGGTAVKPSTGGTKRLVPVGKYKQGDVSAYLRFSTKEALRRGSVIAGRPDVVVSGEFRKTQTSNTDVTPSFRKGPPIAIAIAIAKDVDPMMGTGAFREASQEGRNGDLLRKGEVVPDIGVMRTNIAAGTNKTHKLDEALTSLFSFETKTALAEVVNGVNAHLKAAVVKLNEKVKEGTREFIKQNKERLRTAGRYMVLVSGVSTLKSQANKDPFTGEVMHDVANNAVDALGWEPQPRKRVYNIMADTVANSKTHARKAPGAFKDAVSNRFKLAKEKLEDTMQAIREKFLEIREKCRV